MEKPTNRPIYLDHNASTPLHPRVRQAVIRALDEGFGNPSAEHAFGRRARAIVDEARAEVAALLGCDADEIVLTGGGTEANNLALRGVDARTIVISAVEHPATAEPARILGASGVRVVEVPVSRDGAVDPEAVAGALAGAAGPALVSVILAQNETGVLQPLAAIAARARAAAPSVLVHADAAQAVGKIAVDVRSLGVDLLSVAGHKLYAPKGVGVLYVRRGVRLSPLVVGAPATSRGLRPGTENVAGIAGLGAACALCPRRPDEGGRAAAGPARSAGGAPRDGRLRGPRRGGGAAPEHGERPASPACAGRRWWRGCPRWRSPPAARATPARSTPRARSWRWGSPSRRRSARCG